MADDLRAQIVTCLEDRYDTRWMIHEQIQSIADAILTLVEQEREKWERATDAAVEKMAEKDAQIATLRKSIADIHFVAAKARDTMPMGVYPRNQFKHLADFAFDALRETPAPQEPDK